MSTREYIGARYVPKFAEPFDWTSARRYEALEIVYHLGASYTSKKPVPVGIDINNTEYWALTGNYNAQVEEFRNETARVKMDYISLLQNGEKLIGKSWIPDPTAIAMGGAILSNTNRVLVIGDSYNDQGRKQYSTYGVTTWGYHLQELFGFDASNYKTIGVSSAGWTCKGTSDTDKSLSNVNFEDIVRRLHTPENFYDKIIIVGGLNDLIRADTGGADVTKVPEAIESCVQYIKAINKNTDVYIGVCGYTFHKYQYKLLELVNNVSKANAPFTFLNGVQNAIKGKSFLLSDYLHPTDEAEIRIAKAVYNAINGNTMHYRYKPSSYSVKSSTDTSKTALNFDVKIQDDLFKMTIYDVTANLKDYTFNNGGVGATSIFDVNIVENYEFTAFQGSNDYCVCNTTVRCMLSNIQCHNNVGTNLVAGEHECILNLRWSLKSVIPDGGSAKDTTTILTCTVSGYPVNEITYYDSSGTAHTGRHQIRGGKFTDSLPIRLCYSTDICSSMSV